MNSAERARTIFFRSFSTLPEFVLMAIINMNSSSSVCLALGSEVKRSKFEKKEGVFFTFVIFSQIFLRQT
jgi:hypothetical protein